MQKAQQKRDKTSVCCEIWEVPFLMVVPKPRVPVSLTAQQTAVLKSQRFRQFETRRMKPDHGRDTNETNLPIYLLAGQVLSTDN